MVVKLKIYDGDIIEQHMKKEYVKYIILAITLVGLFYWFQIRPSNIRKECHEYVLMNGLYETSNEERDELGRDWQKINKEEEIRTALHYQKCLGEHGLEK